MEMEDSYLKAVNEKGINEDYERIVNLLAHKEIKEMLNSRNLHIGSQIKLTLKEPIDAQNREMMEIGADVEQTRELLGQIEEITSEGIKIKVEYCIRENKEGKSSGFLESLFDGNGPIRLIPYIAIENIS